MQTITKQYDIYSFDELSEEAKEKAIEKLYDINVDYEWYDMTVSEDFSSKLAEIGLSGSKVYFDLDRGSYLYYDDLSIIDSKKFLQACKFDLRKNPYKQIIDEDGLELDKQHYGGGQAKNFIDVYYTIGISNKDIEIMQELLDSTMEEFLSQLRKEYEYLTDREAIEDTIQANEYQFLENGSLF